MNTDDTRSAGSPSTTPTPQSTGNTAPLDHVLPDDPSTWTALDHAVAIANLRGAIIAREREEAQELRERVARAGVNVMRSLICYLESPELVANGVPIRVSDETGDMADILASDIDRHDVIGFLQFMIQIETERLAGDLDGAGEGGE